MEQLLSDTGTYEKKKGDTKREAVSSNETARKILRRSERDETYRICSKKTANFQGLEASQKFVSREPPCVQLPLGLAVSHIG